MKPETIIKALQALKTKFGIKVSDPELELPQDDTESWMITFGGYYLHPEDITVKTIGGGMTVHGYAIDREVYIPGSYCEPEAWDVDESIYSSQYVYDAIKELVLFNIADDVHGYIESMEECWDLDEPGEQEEELVF